MNALNPVRTSSDHFARHPAGARPRRRGHCPGAPSASAAPSCSSKVRLRRRRARALPARAVRRHAAAGRDRAGAGPRAAADRLRRADHRARRDRAEARSWRPSRTCSASSGFTAVLISHDLGVVLEATDRVLVMYAGRIVEDQPSDDLLAGRAPPLHRGAARLLRRPAGRRGRARRHPGHRRPTCRSRWPAARSRRAARWPRTICLRGRPAADAARRGRGRLPRAGAAAARRDAEAHARGLRDGAPCQLISTTAPPRLGRGPPLVVEGVTKTYRGRAPRTQLVRGRRRVVHASRPGPRSASSAPAAAARARSPR